MNEENEIDMMHAKSDLASIELTSKNPIEGYVYAPYINTLITEYHKKSSEKCAIELGQEIVDYDNRIRKLYSVLYIKQGNVKRITENAREINNIQGYEREQKSIDNLRISIIEMIDEKQTYIKKFKFEIIQLINEYNNRIARYVDEIAQNKNVNIDFDKLNDNDIPALISDELLFCKTQKLSYEKRLKDLFNNDNDGENNTNEIG
ncbi:MAG: hypothetical protein LBN03_01310 [Bifidobacteriaceae bacterium]|jgi:hypothetical protein|nr:hypothetical protein [Bifidobacteriaceae bacterium]